MLQAALVLSPGGAHIRVAECSAAEEVALIKEKDREEFMRYEKGVRAGSFGGGVAVQVVRRQERTRHILYTGELLLLDERRSRHSVGPLAWVTASNCLHTVQEPLW
jgi:hypothetical protein